MFPKTQSSIDFLQRLRPTGPWVLTSILPNKGAITTRTFTVPELEEMTGWINGQQGTRNIYYTLNSVEQIVDSKPSKQQITEMIALHCDCDPRAGEDVATERERLLKKISEFNPKPSIIIDSGGGYQAIFLLAEPIKLDGTAETAEAYEAYNRQLELLLEGDHCFNIDRILRLPGTINVPDEKKLKKGRSIALADIVEASWEKYALSAFTKAPLKIQSPEDHLPGGVDKVKLSGNLATLSVEDLRNKGIPIDDKVKELIINGIDPQFPSRSEALFSVVCALVRAKADNETIAGVIMNRENKISESVLDKPRPERYCARQIQNAREEVESPILRQFNSRHAVIADVGGRCKIISEVFDHSLLRAKISYQSFDDFRNRYCHQRVAIATDSNGQPVYKPAGQWWINHPLRRQYETTVFAPGKEIPDTYNLWQGFACEAIPGNCDLFFEHILQNLCQGNEEYNRYLLSWMARCVQKPDCPGEVALVFRGEMGTGKGVFAKHFGSLFGRHFLQISDPKHLVGSFNSHLRDCIVLFGDEAFYAGDKKHESVLKSLITEPTITIESKGVDIFASPNYTHIILASNSNWVVPAGNNERRFFVLEVGKEKMQDKKYFAAVENQINAGGREALLFFLLNYDIKGFEVRDVPKTLALQDQKLLSYTPEESWWFEKLEEGRILKDHDNWEKDIMKNSLQDDYVFFMQRIGVMRKASPTALGKFLSKVCPGGIPKSFQKMAKVKQVNEYGGEYAVNRRMYFYALPELPDCRAHWDKYHGGPFKWGEIVPHQKEMKYETDSTKAFE